jgi:hypothetical protein
VSWPRAEINPSHLFRLEERFFFDADDGNSLFRLRFRYQISTGVGRIDPESGRGWNSPFSAEFFSSSTTRPTSASVNRSGSRRE